MTENARPSNASPDIYYPTADVVAQANITAYMLKKGFSTWDDLHRWSLDHSEEFWGEMAQRLEWYKPYISVFDDSNKPFFKWFTGGQTNIVHNAIDRHMHTWRRNKLAYIWEGEDGTVRNFSYADVNREVCRLANVLKAMGVKKGDIVSIYLPRVPELPFAMLACAKIGAAHSVIYGGFSHEALRDRIADAHSKVLIT
ncbi:MAG: AMP-binding protein, partial [Chloroflexales bacterium]|nr:AMP-binding protein [Chloroflexales bacterium]